MFSANLKTKIQINTALTNFAVAGGIGILATALLLAYESLIVNKYKYGEVVAERYSAREIVINVLKALPLMAVPIGFLLGIYLGVFSITEAGALGSFIALVLAAVYKRLNKHVLYNILVKSAASAATVFLLLSTSYMLSYVWSMTKVYVALNNIFRPLATMSTHLLLLFVAAPLFIFGMFIDLMVFNVTLAPVLAALLRPFGVSVLHLNALFLLGNMIGVVTPPVGAALAVACRVAGIKLDLVVMKETLKLVMPYVILYVITIFVPDVALWLPKVFGMPIA